MNINGYSQVSKDLGSILELTCDWIGYRLFWTEDTTRANAKEYSSRLSMLDLSIPKQRTLIDHRLGRMRNLIFDPFSWYVSLVVYVPRRSRPITVFCRLFSLVLSYLGKSILLLSVITISTVVPIVISLRTILTLRM